MATDIIARGMAAEAEKTANKYKAGANIIFTENADGTVAIEASGEVSSEDTVARNLINNHKEDTGNPHGVTAEQIGLGNVDNTSDLEKPISNAMQEALDKKVDSNNLGTAAYKDIPTDGNASDSQVVLGNDSRLSDSRKADGGNAATLETHPASDFVLSSDFEAHAGNAEIHVTAEEKAAWNNKAELSDIPSTLPANGGNADTVDGLHASSFFINNKPHVTSVTSTESSIHLKWLPVDGATKYAVSKYNDDTSYGVYSSDITDTEYTITGLTAGTEYSILVQAYINGAWTTFSTADHIIVRTNMFSSGTSASSFLQSITSDLLTRSINDVFAGTYSVEQSYTPDFPTGFGTYGILDSRIYGSIQYQTIWFDTGVIIHRERIIDTIDWSTWQKINDGGNADAIDGMHASDFYAFTTGLRKGTLHYDIFSNSLSPSHPAWNSFCAIESAEAIENAPSSTRPARYEVWTCGENINRGYQIAVSLFERNKIFIRYLQDGNWSGWYDIADGGNAATLESHPASDFVLKTDYDALAARVAALEGN